MSQPIVIIGAGQAGGQLAFGLRNEHYSGPIVLIGAEGHAPYQRPPLSKQHLTGAMGLEKVWLKPASAYAESNIQHRSACRVEAIDRDAHRITLDDGSNLDYRSLALATGSRLRRLALPGSDLVGIHYLRTLDDMRALQADLQAELRLVLVGGGYIGLEVAAAGIKLGLRVTVLEQGEQLMSRVVGSEVADFYFDLHARAGVSIRTGVEVTGFEGDDRVRAVVDAAGNRYPADVVLIGVGVEPETELAEAAGLRDRKSVV